MKNLNKTLDKEECAWDKFYADAARATGYYMIAKPLIKELGEKQAMTIVNFITWERTTKKEWMKISYAQIQKEFGWSKVTVSKTIKQLVDKDLLFTENIKKGTSQFYKINHKKLQKILDWSTVSGSYG